MKVVLHGLLRTMFGREFTVQTDVPADAIEGVSRQLEGWPRQMLVDVVDHPTLESLKTPTKLKEIHLVPSMSGGGGAFGKILIGVALIAASFIPGIGQAVQIALISAGISMALSGVMQLFMKAPRVDRSEDPPPSKYFSNNQNTTAAGTYRSLSCGRVKLYGHWLSIQIDAKALVLGRFPSTAPA